MSDPERLLNGSAGALSAQLLRAGHHEAPSRRSLERTLAAVGVATTTLGAAGTAGALGSATSTAGAAGTVAAGTVGSLGAAGKAATTLTLLSLAKWAGMGVAGGIVVSLAAHGIDARGTATRAVTNVTGTAAGSDVRRAEASVTRWSASGGATAATSGEATAAAPVPDATTEAPPGPEASSAPLGPLEPAGRSPATAPKALVSLAPFAAPAAGGDDTASAPLAAEVTFVDRGRALLQRGDALGALATLAGYERAFPERRLLPEVLFLRMEASVAAGDAVSGKAFARLILQTYGKSPHAARARALLGERPPGQP
jgi:hypothetical protein